MRVLAVQVDEGRADRGRAPSTVASRPSTYARARPSAGSTRASTALGAVRADEAALDARFSRAVADQRRVGARAEQQLDRFDQQRLARAGLARDRGEAGRDEQGQVVDDAEVRDAELDEHAGHRSERPNLAFRIWWKSRGPKVTMRAGFGPAVQVTVSPLSSMPMLAAVEREHRAARVGNRETKLLVGVEDERAVEQHVRRDRREQQAPVPGRDDRAARGERVGGRARRGRDDHAVGHVGRERRCR